MNPTARTAPQPVKSACNAMRVPITRQALQHIADMMAGYYCDGEDIATLLTSLDGMAAGSAYSEYGTVYLGDLAATVMDEVADFESPRHCTACNGSGEGQYDGTRCSTCSGRGELPSQKQASSAERASEYADYLRDCARDELTPADRALAADVAAIRTQPLETA